MLALNQGMLLVLQKRIFPVCARHTQRVIPQTRTYSMKQPPDPSNQNYALLCKIYSEYEEHYKESEHSPFKLKAFGTAMNVIANLPFKIQSLEDVEKMKGIGAGIKRRIEQHLLTEAEVGKTPMTSRNIENKKELLQAVQLFQTVSGIGPARARKFAEQGFRTLEDIVNDTKTFEGLPQGVKTAFIYANRLSERVQREDIEKLSAKISKVLTGFEVYVTGSYRRGAPSSSDVDVLLFHPDYTQTPQAGQHTMSAKEQKKAREESPLLQIAVPALLKAKVLVEPLTSGPAKWQGIAKLETGEKLCRIDLNLMPTASRGAALVGYTGDAEFNRYLRGKANRVMMRLNDFGLWKRPPGWEASEITSTKDDNEWELVATEKEEDVFRALGETWVDPTKRNFMNLALKRRKGM
ncbi:hypothetical protein FRC19_002672 [Serendipita sp. 401]|nr:hypothetical protein FRC19_002672 [Serendipita sp. 401]